MRPERAFFCVYADAPKENASKERDSEGNDPTRWTHAFPQIFFAPRGTPSKFFCAMVAKTDVFAND